MLAAIPVNLHAAVAAPDQYFNNERDKLQAHLAQAKEALAACEYVRTVWAFRSAFALLLEDFRSRDAVLPVAQRCELFARVCRAWQATYAQLPTSQRDVVAMCRFIEGQRRRVEFFACS